MDKILKSKPDLENLIKRNDIWRASKINQDVIQGISSTYPLLDQHLCGGGWPRDGLTELLLNKLGIGELRLLTPALAKLFWSSCSGHFQFESNWSQSFPSLSEDQRKGLFAANVYPTLLFVASNLSAIGYQVTVQSDNKFNLKIHLLLHRKIIMNVPVKVLKIL